MPSTAATARVPTLVLWVLASYAALLVVLLLMPSSGPPSWLVETCAGLATDVGLPPALAAPERVEPALNVAAFVPVALLGALLRPSLGWRDWTAVGFVASLTVEVVQAAVLDARVAAYSDVVANTAGALLGALLARAVTARRVG